MATRKIKGITIEIDGNTTKLSDSLKKIDNKLTKTNSNLKDVNKLLKFDPSNTELLSQKQTLLSSAIGDTKERLKQLNLALDGIDKGTKKYDLMQREISETKSNLKGLESQYKSFGSVATKQIENVANKLDKAGEKMKSAGSKMTVGLTTPIVAAGTASAMAASDYEENLNKVNVAFDKSAQKVIDFSETATEQFGLSKNSALEMTSQFGDMGTSMGLTQENAADMAISLAGLAGDLSSFKNIGIDQAMTALNGVFTGETESLKTLGVVMTETNLKQFAEDLGLVYDEMDQAQKVTLRYQYVMEATKNAQGDYSRTSDGTANSMRTLKEEINNLAVAFGQELLPIITPIIQEITKMVQWIGSLDSGTKGLITNVLIVVAIIGPLLVGLGSLATSVLSITKLLKGVSGILGIISSASLPAVSSAAAAAATSIIASMSAIMPVILGIAGVLIFIIGLMDKIKHDKINAEWDNYLNNTTAGMTGISEEQAKNWMNSDEVHKITNPSGTTSYYVNNSDYTWGKANAAANGWTDAGEWGNNAQTVNMTVNVDHIDELDDLLKIQQQAQSYSRMGTTQ